MTIRPNEFTVVLRQNSYTPGNALYGAPGLFLPPVGSTINVSCVFTWDKPVANEVARAWLAHGYRVRVGGPALDDPGEEFTPGKYVRQGITITSRGCPFSCPWCYVPKREGKLRELKTIWPGNIVNDNNLLACSNQHLERVFLMLRTQSRIEFKGGLDVRLLKPWHIDALRGLRIHEIWIAADDADRQKLAIEAIRRLRGAGFSAKKIRCYVMVGYGDETIASADARLQELYDVGAYPFAQVYDGLNNTTKPEWSDEFRRWKQFARKWERPAIYVKSKGRP